MDNSDIQKAFEQRNGVMRTSELKSIGLHYRALQKLIDDSLVEQVRRGYYQYVSESSFSEVPAIAALFPDGVLCLESALDYYGYTERTPSAWQIAVDSRTRRDRFKVPKMSLRVKPHFIVRDRFEIGISEALISGTKINVYDRERTICDCLLHRNKMDSEVFSFAIRSYLNDPQKNISRLSKYAELLHVQKKVREVLGIWL